MKGFRHVTHPANDVSTSEIPLSEWQVKQNLLWKICKYLKTLFTSHFARTWGRKKKAIEFCSLCSHLRTAACVFILQPAPLTLYLWSRQRNLSTDSRVKSTTCKKSDWTQTCQRRIHWTCQLWRPVERNALSPSVTIFTKSCVIIKQLNEVWRSTSIYYGLSFPNELFLFHRLI